MPPILFLILGVVAALSGLVWIGTRIVPRAFPSHPQESEIPEELPMPPGLPAPVQRFYEILYGDSVPHIHSFILTGRGRVRFKGLTFPARLRFTHQAGKGYRHYIEAVFWGLPMMQVNEHYLDWRSRLALPFGVVENEPRVDQAANLGLWSETMLFPAVYLTTEGVRWEGMDETTARLFVPFKDEEHVFTVHFDARSGLVTRMKALRWKNAGDESRTPWEAQILEWGRLAGWQMPVLFGAQWMDEDSPWLVARIEDIVWNVDVQSYIRQEGP
jgi:hypothetical protein